MRLRRRRRFNVGLEENPVEYDEFGDPEDSVGREVGRYQNDATDVLRRDRMDLGAGELHRQGREHQRNECNGPKRQNLFREMRSTALLEDPHPVQVVVGHGGDAGGHDVRPRRTETDPSVEDEETR